MADLSTKPIIPCHKIRVEGSIKRWFLLTDLKEFYPDLFKGTARKISTFLTKHNVPKHAYIYAKQLSDGTWEVRDGSNRLDKILVLKKWFDSLVAQQEPVTILPILELEEEERFSDGETTYDIEVRGERNVSGIYFSLEDVSVMINAPNLYQSVIRKDGGYNINKDYIYLLVPDADRKLLPTSGGTIKKLFLTYVGMLRVLFVSRSEKCEHFILWATNTLFTLHLGTQEQKQVLVAKTLDTTPATLRCVFNKTASDIPGVYLYEIGSVKEWNSAKIGTLPEGCPKNGVIYKIGFTADMERRSKEHEKTFGDGIKLVCYSSIDYQYISDAEAHLKSFLSLSNLVIPLGVYTEIVCLTPRSLKEVKRLFELIGNAYGGRLSTLIANHKRELSESERRLESLQKDFDYEKRTLKSQDEKHALELESLRFQTNSEIDSLKLEHISKLKAQKKRLKTKYETKIEDIKASFTAKISSLKIKLKRARE